MAAQGYKNRLMRVLDSLSDERVADVVRYAERLREQEPQVTLNSPRRLGTFRGKIHIEPSFFDPLPEDILDAFEGKGQ